MKIDILTLFPNMFRGPFDESIVKRAIDKKLVEIDIHNLRNWAKDRRKTVDDRPYGGGKGMVFMIQPVYDAIKFLKSKTKNKKSSQKIILLSPQGKVFNQQKAQNLSKIDHLILICGHYEGVDERVRENLIDEEISIGDYVLTGGEIPAIVITDTIVRLLPGVLDKQAIKNESFSNSQFDNLKIGQLLDYPQYTRPAEFKGWKVPEILLSGNHKDIEKWRQKKAKDKTKKQRPELIKRS